jgi:hypothetical protein
MRSRNSDPEMKSIPRPRPPANYQDLKPEILARELSSFAVELERDGPITAPRLKGWVGESVSRKYLLSGFVCGTIRWPKSRGRPLTAKLTDAFEMEHHYLAEDFRINSGGAIEDISRWIKQIPPGMSDASNESEYRVYYHFFATYWFPNRVQFWLRDVPWEKGSTSLLGYRRLDPKEFRPFRNYGEYVVLPDIELKLFSWIQTGIRVIPGAVVGAP